jgi:GTP-binding protein YchF
MAQLSIGIIGLPNVGKSTLFQALTAVSVPAENYPFCTIDPNVGVIQVPDARLDQLHEMLPPREKVSPVVEFVDIAGLVAGASHGEGLGNRFLHHVREADALIQVVRAFEDPTVVQPEGTSDPIEGLGIIETELALADLEVVVKRRQTAERKARTGDKEEAALTDLLERVERRLDQGEPARNERCSEQEERQLRSLALLTLKPMMFVLNVDEPDESAEHPLEDRVRGWLGERAPDALVLTESARLESEIAQLAPEERAEYALALGLEEPGLDRLIRASYRLLGLHTFFTIGDNEVRGWTVPVGAHAPEAAGKVHTDFERGFIRAETIHFKDFVNVGSLKTARERGLIRSEGKEYVVQDGDILFFRTST